MIRLLIIGSSAPHSLEMMYAYGLRMLGADVMVHDAEACLSGLNRNRWTNRITNPVQHLVLGTHLRRFFRGAPPVDSVIVFKGLHLSAEVLADCKRSSGVPWFNLNPDSPWEKGHSTSSPNIRACIPLYDGHFTWSRLLEQRFRDLGCRDVTYLPFGFDPRVHFPAKMVDSALSRTISFVGSYDERRAQLLAKLEGLPLVIHGNGWEKFRDRAWLRSRVISPAIHDEKLRRVISGSLATINMLRPQNAGAHNMRTFEVPAIGGLMITTRSAEQQGFFPEGEASLMYQGGEELRTLVTSLLRQAVDTARIRTRALELARPHSYLERARTMLDVLMLFQS